MVDRVPAARYPFLEPVRLDALRSAVAASPMGAAMRAPHGPPVALLAELAWDFDRQGLADELRALTPNERSAVLRMAEDLAEAAERAMQGER